MWRDDFVVSVSHHFVRSCRTPLLVLPGTDRYHPTATGREIAALAPNASHVRAAHIGQDFINRALSRVGGTSTLPFA